MKSFTVLITAALLSFSAAKESCPLHDGMEQLGDVFKAIRAEKDFAKRAELAREAQLAILKAAPDTPKILEKIKDAKEKAKAAAEYRRQMGALYVAFCELELAYVEQDETKVNTLLEKIKELRKIGHQQFIEE